MNDVLDRPINKGDYLIMTFKNSGTLVFARSISDESVIYAEISERWTKTRKYSIRYARNFKYHPELLIVPEQLIPLEAKEILDKRFNSL